jgi:dTDP-4-dehydrorhamnose reductase
MRVAVVGGTGQLGDDVVRAFAASGDTVIALSHADMDITVLESVSATMDDVRPDLIVNTAAMHHVERCEENPQMAFEVNALGPRNLAMVARSLHAKLMHISTDYVFDGSRRQPYLETDLPRPLNTYGNTKLAGEYYVRSVADSHFVLRTSGLYGKSPCRGKSGLNFVDLMRKLGMERGKVRVVDSEIITPTSTSQLAQQMVLLGRSDNFGLFHATAEGSCSWFDFAREIFRISNLAVEVEPAKLEEFPAKVPRPGYSVLENTALKAIGMNALGPWQAALREYLECNRLTGLAVTVSAN